MEISFTSLAVVAATGFVAPRAITHPQFRQKLEAAGCGIFIPFFFVTSGIRYDAGALFGHPSTLARVPLFLAILLTVRGLPALLYRPLATSRETAARCCRRPPSASSWSRARSASRWG